MDVTRAIAAALLAASAASAQTGSFIEDEIDGVRSGMFRLGPMYVTPTVRLESGYDSNVLSTPDARSDVRALVGPAVRLGVPFGDAAFVGLYQELDFVYYQDTIDLRQVNDVTDLRAGFGGRRFLFLARNELRNEVRRPTTEFDFPAETRRNTFDASFRLGLGWRHSVGARYENARDRILDTTVGAELVPERLNLVRQALTLDLTRRLTAKTRLFGEGFFERLDYEDPTRLSNGYGARVGFQFSPHERENLDAPLPRGTGLAGRFALGYKEIAPEDPSRVPFSGLIGDVDVSTNFEAGHSLRGIFERDAYPSIFEDNWFFVQNRFGGFVVLRPHARFGLEVGAIFGRNEYPLPAETGEEIDDRHVNYRLTVDVYLLENFSVGVVTDYLDRESNVRTFDKDRLQIGFRMALRP